MSLLNCSPSKHQIPTKMQDVLFPSMSVTPSWLMTAFRGLCRCLNLFPHMVENCICEAIQSNPAHDTFHPGQWIFFLDENTNDIVLMQGDEQLRWSFTLDVEASNAYPVRDSVLPMWAWWEVEDDDLSTMHEWFMNECERRGIVAQEQISFPHGEKPRRPVWLKYISKVKKVPLSKKMKSQIGARPKPDVEKQMASSTRIRIHLRANMEVGRVVESKRRRTLDSPSVVTDKEVPRLIDIERDATSAWRDLYNDGLPAIEYQICHHNGNICWMAKLNGRGNCGFFETKSWHGPVGDSSIAPVGFQSEGEQRAMYTKKKHAAVQIYWLIICRVSSITWRLQWVANLLDGERTVHLQRRGEISHDWSVLQHKHDSGQSYYGLGSGGTIYKLCNC